MSGTVSDQRAEGVCVSRRVRLKNSDTSDKKFSRKFRYNEIPGAHRGLISGTGLLHRGKELLCRSRLFRRIFLSYLAFILVFLAGYSAVAIIDYNTNKRSELDAQYEAIASRLGTVFDNEMVQARYMTASINNSSALKNIYTKTVLSSSSLDSWLYEQAKSQMLSIQSQMNNLAISHLLLVFHNSNRIYTSSSVISLKDPYTGGLSGSGLTLDTVSNLLKTENSNVLMQREYLIFYSDYMRK